MFKYIKSLRHSLVSKIILTGGITLLLCISVWSYFNVKYQKQTVMENVAAEVDRLSNTIKLGTHYAMMLNSGDDIKQIIKNISTQKEIENIRIYNKNGRIKFSNRDSEIDRITDIKGKACYICHRCNPPLSELYLFERTRIFNSPDGYRLLGIMSPIYNEPTCSSASCHVHPQGKKILGLLDVVVSLDETDNKMFLFSKYTILSAVLVFFATFVALLLFVVRFVKLPIKKLMVGTHHFAKKGQLTIVDVDQDDEMGQLADAFNKMVKEIGQKQAELNKQREEYQRLFEHVPCIITVQDRNFKLLRYNHEFYKRFNPVPGDSCFRAYKRRSEKCDNCPVEKTFEDGESYRSEETRYNKDGTKTHWIVSTSPVRDSKGEITAVMEMCLDITHRRQLEKKLEISEKKYHDIFNNIPNSLFVLDMDTLEILDCNESVKITYGYSKDEIIGKSFLDMFSDDEKDQYVLKLKRLAGINQAKHVTKDGKTFFVSVRVSPSDYPGRRVLIVTTIDITKRLETEQQLIQANKMATLGEMSTGVAHELNQPLSVIQTIGNFFMRKIRQNERIDDETFLFMAEGINRQVERASKIINHMREFGRKSDLDVEKVQVNEVLERALEIFSQQLKLRGIEVEWDLEEDLPVIMADSSRLEQVFINLLINAKDAVEEKWGEKEHSKGDKKIIFRTRSKGEKVIVEVSDTGTGIPDAIADKLFEPFFTTKEVGRGTGLGLSISYGIVQDYRGSIHAVSNKDGGACFIIEFPIPDEKQ